MNKKFSGRRKKAFCIVQKFSVGIPFIETFSSQDLEFNGISPNCKFSSDSADSFIKVF